MTADVARDGNPGGGNPYVRVDGPTVTPPAWYATVTTREGRADYDPPPPCKGSPYEIDRAPLTISEEKRAELRHMIWQSEYGADDIINAVAAAATKAAMQDAAALVNRLHADLRASLLVPEAGPEWNRRAISGLSNVLGTLSGHFVRCARD